VGLCRDLAEGDVGIEGPAEENAGGTGFDGGSEIVAPAVLNLELPPDAKRLRATFQLEDTNKKEASVQVVFTKEVPEAWQQLYYPRRQVIAWPENRDRVKASVADFTNLVARSTKLRGSELADTLADVPGISGDYLERLGEFTDSIRQVEQQIDRAVKNERPPNGWKPTLDQPDLERPEEGWPEEVPDYMRLMMDLILLAFRMDKTRIATLQFNNDGVNYMKFGFLGIPNMDHHGISHHANKPERMDHHAITVKYHCEQLSYFMDRMKEIDEGGTSMLDNSSILFYWTQSGMVVEVERLRVEGGEALASGR